MVTKKQRITTADWLPLAKKTEPVGPAPTGDAFRPEWIDFENGIRVGNLEPHERITQILKYHLERRYATPFVTDRWGRGVFWQWICWLPKANRAAKPLSSHINFGCSKLFITTDRAKKVFKFGLQIERGYVDGPEAIPGCKLAEDWDWHRLVGGLKDGSKLDAELQRLIVREGFVAEVGDWAANAVFNAESFKSAGQVRKVLAKYPGNAWAGFQLYYPMSAREVRKCSGHELTQAITAAFGEVVPAMNLCMQVPLVAVPRVLG